MKDFVSNNSSELIAEIPKNSREVIRVERSLFHGPTLANVRVWFRSEDGELRQVVFFRLPPRFGLNRKIVAGSCGAGDAALGGKQSA